MESFGSVCSVQGPVPEATAPVNSEETYLPATNSNFVARREGGLCVNVSRSRTVELAMSLKRSCGQHVVLSKSGKDALALADIHRGGPWIFPQDATP